MKWHRNVDKKDTEDIVSVTEGLKRLYKTKILPLEEHYLFNEFHSPPMEDADFDAKPMILLVGQYSTGKTTFINYLLGRKFPGMRIGPEPTTDKFIVIMHGKEDTTIPGHALIVDPTMNFRPLQKFGGNFLNRLTLSKLDSPVLETVSFIDTPGILSGEKQRTDRGYEFTQVLEWFAERVDRIILLFDAHKLDISDEFQRSIESLRGHDDKIRIILNKADMVDQQQLMRIYGALMWSLGKVLNTPEVARVYIGSFWDEQLKCDTNRKLFESEEKDLFMEIQDLPKNAATRKINDIIKRARLAKVHAYIISTLKKEVSSFMNLNKESRKKDLIKHLNGVYRNIEIEYQISPGDFPDIYHMQEKLANHDFTKFKPFNAKLIENLDKVLGNEISGLMARIPKEQYRFSEESPSQSTVSGGVFAIEEDATPFGYGRGEGADEGALEPDWVVEKYRDEFDEIFTKLGPVGGKVSGAQAKNQLVKSKLPNSVLSKIWKLADVDNDGSLDIDEFALAMHLINIKISGHEIPEKLPQHLVPPSKRY